MPRPTEDESKKPVDYKETALRSKAKTLADLIKRKIEADAKKKEYEASAKALSDEIVTLLASAGQEKILFEDTRVTICSQPGRETVSKTKLIELGVSLKIIKKATTTGEPYNYALVTPPKPAEDKKG